MATTTVKFGPHDRFTQGKHAFALDCLAFDTPEQFKSPVRFPRSVAEKGIFPLMRLSAELRVMIYEGTFIYNTTRRDEKELLLAPSNLPQHLTFVSFPVLVQYRDVQPYDLYKSLDFGCSGQLQRLSKFVYTEALPILYSMPFRISWTSSGDRMPSRTLDILPSFLESIGPNRSLLRSIRLDVMPIACAQKELSYHELSTPPFSVFEQAMKWLCQEIPKARVTATNGIRVRLKPAAVLPRFSGWRE